jgi:hypothetical protein
MIGPIDIGSSILDGLSLVEQPVLVFMLFILLQK